MDIISLLDWAVSCMTMGSFLYASLNKERINESLQYNVINLFAGLGLIIVGYYRGLDGLIIRQLFFIIVILRNLWKR